MKHVSELQLSDRNAIGMAIDHSEDGSVEAGLTLIPTTAFFLLAMQLVVAGSFQVIETIDLQSTLSRTALLGSQGGEFSFERSRIVDQQSAEMPGGGELLIAKTRAKVPSVSSLAPQSTDVLSRVIVYRE
jgi:hypothetical protein